MACDAGDLFTRRFSVTVIASVRVKTMRLDISALTHVGQRKTNNEDSYGVFREDTPGLQLFDTGALLCVADGLGGHVGGEIASKLAVSMVKDCLQSPAPPNTGDPEQYGAAILDVLRAAIIRANESIHQTNRAYIKNGRPMGTTLLAGLISRNCVYIANVGDSRCYHIRDGEILAATEDHSWVDEQVKLGLMSRAEAESDSRRNLVTRCIGTHPEVPIDTYTWPHQPGDHLLFCTDGLVNMVKDAEIQAVFRRRGSSGDLAHRLVDLANEHGGKDNITVLVAHISPSPLHSIELRITSFFRRHGKKVLWGLITLLFGAACFAAGYFLRGLGF